MRHLTGFTVAAAFAICIAACAASAETRTEIRIDETEVYPESITSTAAGDVINGSLKGIVFRAEPGASVAKPWIRPSAENGLQAVFGVLADERSGTLWLCSVPNPFRPPQAGAISALMAFDLKTGAHKGAWPLPPERAVCNDMAVDSNGTVWVADTSNGRILKLAKGGGALELYAQDEKLRGIDGIAFSGDGTLYVNIVTRGALLRVNRKADGALESLTELKLSEAIAGPDGMRLIEGNRFLLAEGQGGRIDEVTIDGDTAKIRVLRSGLMSPPGVTLVGRTAFAVEGKIGYLIDPKLKGQDPGTFRAVAVPLP
jgi:hypothetical protein